MALRFNEQRFRQMSTSPTDTIGLYLRKQGRAIEATAKQLATNEGLVRSGRYRDSFAWVLLSDGAGLVLRIGNAMPYARLIERGTPAHRIDAKRRVVNALGNITKPGQEGGLWWTHGADRGWFVPDHPLQSVNHPGTRPYRILQRAVAGVLRRGGST